MENADTILILKVREKVTGATCENVLVKTKQQKNKTQLGILQSTNQV